MRTSRPTLFLTVGLPGAGKTTHARELASKHSILRLTPDDWMAPLFGHSDAEGRRDILEGRMIWVAREVLVSEPPPGSQTWPQWASERWPTLPRLDT